MTTEFCRFAIIEYVYLSVYDEITAASIPQDDKNCLTHSRHLAETLVTLGI
jgi:hypothetical protein